MALNRPEPPTTAFDFMPLDKITILSNEDPLGACPMKEFSAVLKYVPPKKTNIKRQDL